MSEILKYVIFSKEKITESTIIFKLKPISEKITFASGQFLFLHFIDNAGNSIIKRPYSIASTPDKSEIELCIKMINGQFTSKLEKANIGDFLGISVGGGHFTYNNEKKAAFIAGGSGIAPIISMLRTIEKNKIQGEFVFFYSSKTENSILYRKELERLSKSNPSIKIIHTLTQEQWFGEKGRINSEMINRYVKDPSLFSWWVCGPMIMIKSIREDLTKLNVEIKKIKLEGWG